MQIVPTDRDWPENASSLADQMAEAVEGNPIFEAALGMLLRADPDLWTDEGLLGGGDFATADDAGKITTIHWDDLGEWLDEIGGDEMPFEVPDYAHAAAAAWIGSGWQAGYGDATLDGLGRTLGTAGCEAMVDAVAHALGVTR